MPRDKLSFMYFTKGLQDRPAIAAIQTVLLYTECQSSFIPVSYWLRTYHVIVEKFYCLPGNVAKRWTLLLFTGK